MLLRTRREFFNIGLRSAATVSAAAGLGHLGRINAFAQTGPDYKALVCIFLFGGNDSNNMVVPMGSGYTAYQSVRQGLAIPQASLAPLNAPYGLHPNLAEMRTLFNENRAAIVANVGMLVRPTTRAQYLGSAPRPANLFSHSDQQSQWQSAIPSGASSTGWGGRVADRLASLNSSTFPMALSINGGSLLLVGAQTQPGSVDPGTNGQLEGSDGSQAADARNAALQQILNFDSGFSLIQTANFSLREGMRISDILAGLTATPLTTQFPGTGLGSQLQQVARIIQARTALGMSRQIFFCSMGGYDTHSNQAGAHTGLFTELSQAMNAFYNATVEMGVASNVTTFTESEFNRTFQPNANAGTDHAWGGHQFAVGGSVIGGQLYGTFPQLALQGPDDSGNRGNWIPTTSLDQFGATLAKWFGVSDIDLPLVFPNLVNFPTKTLGFA
jgi:uncharacterized protein (DUF1501 family)